MLVRPAFNITIGFFFGYALGDFGKRTAVFQVFAVLRNDGVLSSARRMSSAHPHRYRICYPRPTIADTPILADREKPMIAMPITPTAMTAPRDPYVICGQNVAHRFFTCIEP